MSKWYITFPDGKVVDITPKDNRTPFQKRVDSCVEFVFNFASLLERLRPSNWGAEAVHRIIK